MTVASVEQLFVNIRLEHKHIIIGTIYLPPASNPSVYESHCLSVEELITLSPNADFLIVGDSNLPHTHWYNSDGYLSFNMDHCGRVLEQASTIMHFFNEFNMFQHNNILNVNHNTLDLIFSTLRRVSVLPASEPLCACDLYHPALVISLPGSIRSSLPQTFEHKWNFKHANYAAINDYLGSIHWDEELSSFDINDAVDFLYQHLNYAISVYVPRYSVYA